MTSNIVQIPFSRKRHKLQDFVKIKSTVYNIIYDTIKENNKIMSMLSNYVVLSS